jgi:FxsC-like protein
MQPYFFLSYARGDDDLYVQQFFRDLSAEVRSYAGLGADWEVGFLDTHSIEVGATWSQQLTNALATCQTFIALISPRYLVSEACGREWAIFADRVQAAASRSEDDRPAALLPVLWLPPRRAPQAVAALRYVSATHPEAYERSGLRQLLRLQRHRRDYLEFVSVLAQQIVQTAERSPLAPAAVPPFEHVTSAFHNGPTGAAIPVDAAPPGPQFVHFVVAAPTRGEAAELRDDTSFYGEHPEDWAPYRPVLAQPIAAFAQDIASRRSFASTVSDAAELGERIEEALRRNEIVVMLVDAWAPRLDHQRRALIECDNRDSAGPVPTTAIMVPSNHQDGETQAAWRQLYDSLRLLLLHRTAAGDEMMFRSSILTHNAFNADLQVVLEVARNRIFARGTVYRQPSDVPVGKRPILEGP